jgi:hypothetical protein
LFSTRKNRCFAALSMTRLEAFSAACEAVP